ncbi:serine O-acetyltransferase [Deinococcus sp. RM]|uniref:serine O-acetyltransferase n=1 Tax=Deinococcus sp. RM TaxID=2316359 RepID=UPI0035125463
MDAVSIQRLSHRLWRLRVPVLPSLLDLINFLVFNSHLHHQTEIGRGTKCAYRGMSVLIHKRAVIGEMVSIGAHVVIGGRSGIERVPIIENDVFIGPNSCILGPITVGKGAIIGAGSVVIKDVPRYTTVAGVPAKILSTEKPK